jgi:hypothetical protein
MRIPKTPPIKYRPRIPVQPAPVWLTLRKCPGKFYRSGAIMPAGARCLAPARIQKAKHCQSLGSLAPVGTAFA